MLPNKNTSLACWWRGGVYLRSEGSIPTASQCWQHQCEATSFAILTLSVNSRLMELGKSLGDCQPAPGTLILELLPVDLVEVVPDQVQFRFLNTAPIIDDPDMQFIANRLYLDLNGIIGFGEFNRIENQFAENNHQEFSVSNDWR